MVRANRLDLNDARRARRIVLFRVEEESARHDLRVLDFQIRDPGPDEVLKSRPRPLIQRADLRGHIGEQERLILECFVHGLVPRRCLMPRSNPDPL